MSTTALIVAAGRGARLGAPRPKAYVKLAGLTILERAVAPFASHPRIDRLGVVAATMPRENLVLAQTPQGFRVDLLRHAMALAERDGFFGTDEASLVERAGGRVTIVPGSERNIKITTALDLRVAEALLCAER